MPSTEKPSKSDRSMEQTGLNYLIGKITDTWFNDNFRDWSAVRRFFVAFMGSATFMVAYYAYDFPTTSFERVVPDRRAKKV